MGDLQDEQAQRHDLHPRTDCRNCQPSPKEAEVSMAKGAESLRHGAEDIKRGKRIVSAHTSTLTQRRRASQDAFSLRWPRASSPWIAIGWRCLPTRTCCWHCCPPNV